MSDLQTRRTNLLRRQVALWTERASWDSQALDISRYILPRAGRFQTTEVNKGLKKDQSILDSTGRLSHRTLAAGMMSGITSPARPWFKLGLHDKELMEFGPVKLWLSRTSDLMRAVFAESNTYNALHSCYEELGAFGTWANIVEPHFGNVIHHYPLTFGEYALACDDEGRVDTMFRRLRMTVGQLVKKFGIANVSSAVKNLHNRNVLDAWVEVYHIIEPREDVDNTKLDAKNMAFASIYMESGANENKFLRESGYKRFRGLAPRWVVTGNDIYGRSPAMDALGDVKQLQHMSLRKAQAIDLKVNPPLQIPTQLKDKANARMPGGASYYDATGPGAGIRSAYEVNLDLSHLLADIQDTRERIKSAFYADLFLMLANDTRSGITATEVAERHEEKLLMLGPVLERLDNELLSPLIDITFDQLAEAKVLPPIPDELRDVELDVEFIGTLAQAQRMIASSGVERFATFVGQLAAAKGDPSVWDKVNTDQMVDEYGTAVGINPALIVPDDDAEAVRAQREQQMAAQQAAAAAPALADTAKTVSDIDTGNLRDVMAGLTGYASGTPAYAG